MSAFLAVEVLEGRCFVVAEIGSNHNGDEDLACRMIDAAAGSGADAVKFQLFRGETLYRPGYAPGGVELLETMRSLEISCDALARLQLHARGAGVHFFATPFDLEAVDFLAGLGVPLMKVASGDVTFHPLLERIAATGIPVLLATGMSRADEVRSALDRLGYPQRRDIVVMQCTSAYPCPLPATHLRAMVGMAERFGLPVGFSDHTEGTTAALVARSLGAVVVEKHFTTDRSLPGPDQAMSIMPDQLRELVDSLAVVDAILGEDQRRLYEPERAVQAVARRSVCASRAIDPGSLLGPADLVFLRPGDGLPPARRDEVIGRRTRRKLTRGQPIVLDDLQNAP